MKTRFTNRLRLGGTIAGAALTATLFTTLMAVPAGADSQGISPRSTPECVQTNASQSYVLPCGAPQTGLGDSSPRELPVSDLLGIGALILAGGAGVAAIRSRRQAA